MKETQVFSPETDTETELPEFERFPIKIGENHITYPRGRRVIGCAIVGLRNRPVYLRRVPLEAVKQQLSNTQMRGQPTKYATDRAAFKVYVWPAPINDYTLEVEYGEKPEDTHEVT